MIKFLLPMFLIGTVAAADGPIIVNNGGGESEYALTFSRQNFRELLAFCRLEACGLNVKQRALLGSFQTASDGLPWPRFRRAASGKLFEISDATYEVIFDQDQLWLDEAKTLSFDIAHSTTVWMDVLNASVRAPESELAPLKALVRSGLRSRFYRLPLALPGIGTLEAFTWRQADESDRLFVRDRDDSTYDFTALARAAAGCGERLTEWQLHSGRWTFNGAEDGSIWMRLVLSQTWTCNGAFKRARLVLVLRSVLKGKSQLIDADSARAYLDGE